MSWGILSWGGFVWDRQGLLINPGDGFVDVTFFSLQIAIKILLVNENVPLCLNLLHFGFLGRAVKTEVCRGSRGKGGIPCI